VISSETAVSPEAKPTILLVDDDDDQLESLAAILSDAGFEIVVAHDGHRALNYLSSTSPPPALIVTDLAMPRMTGWELINVLHSYAGLSRIPVMVLSAADPEGNLVRSPAIAQYVRKPILPGDLVELVKRYAKPFEPPAPPRKAQVGFAD
jgi:CheY-like chemotaxis protein